MVGPKKFFKKRSKRTSTKARVKAEKKVREHNRKVRKEKRKNPKKLVHMKRKDPGVPSDCPFKEEVLKEAQEMRKRREEEKEKRKLDSKQKKAEAKNGTPAAAPQAEVAVAEPAAATSRPMADVVKDSQILLHVVDARSPMESLSAEVEAEVAARGKGHKKTILVLNKADLVGRDRGLDLWLTKLRKRWPAVAFKSTLPMGKNKFTKPLGVDSLMFLLQSYCIKAPVTAGVNIGVVGSRGVGKKSVIRTLLRSKAFLSDQKLVLLDKPGLLEEDEEDENPVVDRAEAILTRCDDKFLRLRFSLAADEDVLAGVPGAGGDRERGARIFLDDWSGSGFKFRSRCKTADDGDEDDAGEPAEDGDLFGLDKIAHVEKAELERLPALLDTDVMELAPKKTRAKREAPQADDVNERARPKRKRK